MIGLDTDVVVLGILLKLDFKPIKHNLRRMKFEWAVKMKEEVVKQYDA